MSFCAGSSAYAQEGYAFELKVLSGIPVGQFGDHIGPTVWGGSFYGSYHLKGTPFAIGAQIGAAKYGSDDPADIPGYPLEPSTGTNFTYNMYLSHVILRYEPPQSRITPYLEALVGVKWLLTKQYLGTTTLTPVYTGTTFMMIDSKDSVTVLSRVALSYGLGGGFRLHLFELSRNRGGNKGPVSVDLNLQGRYLFGGKAGYLREGAISFEDNQRQLDIHRSRTDMLLFNIGISLEG